ncbi:MAG: PP2C family protein-serine/threonine phosphatase [Planctomycetota bacterium]|jgi:sigma-B regulation protein RsbU (phosphoserine phosphatase)
MRSSPLDDRVATAGAAAPASRDSVLAGMACVDTSRNERIPVLMEMVGALSRASTPGQVLHDFSMGMQQLQSTGGYISLSTRGLAPGEYRITRLIDDRQLTNLGDVDSWSRPREFPVSRGGFIAEIIRQAYPEIIHHLDVQEDPIVGTALAGFGSLMAIPLFDDGEPLNWAIMLRENPEGFSVEDLEEAILRANLVGTTVRNVLAAQELREASAKLRAEVEQIARIQRALLPQTLPDIPGVALGASYETFDQAGGDLYVTRPLRSGADGDPDLEGPWALLVADASGHGPAAAVVMAMLYAILEAYPKEPAGPAEVLDHANQHLQAKKIENSFVTALLCIYDPPTKRLTYARAGHTPPVLMTKTGDGMHMDRLDGAGGVPLGILPDVTYEETSTQLTGGQTLVLYTDGVTEAFSPDGRMFGVEGIERSLTECTGEPDCVIDHVLQALQAHEAGTRPSDDQTLVVMRVQE